MKKKLFFLLLFLLFAGKVLGENFESERYRIQFGDVNIGGENAFQSDTYDLSASLGQTAAGQFSSDGYVVKAGFQYLHSIIPFSFSVSSININLGTLTPNTPSTQNTTLTVYFGGAGQYQVTAAETGTLQKSGGTAIADTNCDTSCSETTAGQWTSGSAYGFGYNMTGNDIPATFTNSDYYRRFPDLSAAETPATVMSSTNVGKNRQSTVKFKANISAVQEAGSYQTVIKFVATPSY